MTMTSPARLRAHHSEFVKHSISSRLPDILLSVVNEMPQIDQEGEHASKIKVAAKGLADGTFTITSINSSDGGPCWIEYCRANCGKTAYEVDWWFLENYVYRALMNWVDYFQTSLDPFQSHKRQSIEIGIKQLRQSNVHVDGKDYDSFYFHLLGCLWGNRADLSISAGKVGGHNLETDAHSLLVDDSKQVYQKLLQLQTPQFEGGSSSVVTIILDNCGTELLYDLIFVEYLLRTFPKISICLHCKSHPVFVSDALKVDVMTHIDELKTIGKAGSLSEYCDSGRLSLSEHDFYTSPLSFWEMPEDLKASLFNYGLVITKGDANYRRYENDLHNISYAVTLLTSMV